MQCRVHRCQKHKCDAQQPTSPEAEEQHEDTKTRIDEQGRSQHGLYHYANGNGTEDSTCYASDNSPPEVYRTKYLHFSVDYLAYRVTNSVQFYSGNTRVGICCLQTAVYKIVLTNWMNDKKGCIGEPY